MPRPKLVGDKDKLIPPKQREKVLKWLEKHEPHAPWISVARMAILLMDQGGLRISEAVALRVSDCDVKAKPHRLMIRGAKHRARSHVDEQHVPEGLARELRQVAKRSGPAYYVVGENRDPYSRQHVHRLVKQVHEACGLDGIYNCHSWRHGYLTRVYIETKDLVLTSRLARHRSTKPTEKYIHMSEMYDGKLDTVMAAVEGKSAGHRKRKKGKR